MRRKQTAACWIGLFLLLTIATTQAVEAASFTLGNLLVTHQNQLHEYTLAGDLVQTIAVPHPDGASADLGDVVMDRFGRAHVANVSAFGASYLSTYDPVSNSWEHTQAGFSSGVLSDKDLSVWGDFIHHRGFRFDVNTRSFEVHNTHMFGGTSETSVGLNGVLYSINSGSPRYRVQLSDINTLTNIGTEFQVRDSNGIRLHGNGLAAARNGDLFIADIDGTIYQYSDSHTLLDSIDSDIGSLLDLNLRPDGILVAGSRFGDIVLTDVSLSTATSFTVGNEAAYVGFVVIPVPEPGTCVIAVVGAVLLTGWRLRCVTPKR